MATRTEFQSKSNGHKASMWVRMLEQGHSVMIDYQGGTRGRCWCKKCEKNV